MKQIQQFFSRLLLVIIVLVITDLVAGNLLKKLYFTEKRGQHAQTTYSIDSAREDVIVFGSSRAVRHYDPAILVKSTGLSCYNAGRDAQKMPFYTAVEEVILKRNTPKLIILDVLPYELVTDNAKYERLTILLPYCKNHPELVPFIKEVGPFEPYKLISQTYPFNSTLFISLYNHIFENKVKDGKSGFDPLTHQLTKEEMTDLGTRMKAYEAKSGDNGSEKFMDEKAVAYYERFLENTRKKGIKTVVAISPSLFTERETFIKKKLKEIAGKYPNVSFVDYSNDPEYHENRDLFSDQYHLNATGARKFSEKMHEYLAKNSLLK